jgi:NTP pyrophosphatase (non-canonical NTP hydrolase)
MSIQEAQDQVDQWIKTYGVRYFSELTNMTILTEEVGELARIMARTYGDQSFKKSDLGKDLGDEMADVLWVLMCLANQTGINLTEAFEKNLAKKTDRDKDRHKQKTQAAIAYKQNKPGARACSVIYFSEMIILHIQ